MDEVTTTEMYERNLINISTSITETSTSKHKTLGNSSPKISNLSTTSASPSNKELTNTPFTTSSTFKITTLSSTKLEDNTDNLSSVYPSEPLQKFA
uniref:Uncharacterized protein n=1 Tax=Meloidogyne enterolobii TaxID=390850 RepID=A0A6V7XEH0_MELEN|nr:unnamed protein product [Meloidogyne enterolobii]